MLTWQQILSKLNTGKSGAGAAVNKPLLLLFIFSLAAKGAPNHFLFSDCEDALRYALHKFSAEPSSSPHMAFWHLQFDGCWEIENLTSILPHISQIKMDVE